MSFFEDIAAALDAEGIESRVHDSTMFVPITSDLEVRFEEIDPILPAANVYTVSLDSEDGDIVEEEVLVAVATSVEDAVNLVGQHVATNEAATFLSDLMLGNDERLGDVEFVPDPGNPFEVVGFVAETSTIHLSISTTEGTTSVAIEFETVLPETKAVIDDIQAEIEENTGEPITDDAMLEIVLQEAKMRSLEMGLPYMSETLQLGETEDLDRALDIISLAIEQADDWEAELLNRDWELPMWEDDFDDEFSDPGFVADGDDGDLGDHNPFAPNFNA